MIRTVQAALSHYRKLGAAEVQERIEQDLAAGLLNLDTTGLQTLYRELAKAGALKYGEALSTAAGQMERAGGGAGARLQVAGLERLEYQLDPLKVPGSRLSLVLMELELAAKDAKVSFEHGREAGEYFTTLIVSATGKPEDIEKFEGAARGSAARACRMALGSGAPMPDPEEVEARIQETRARMREVHGHRLDEGTRASIQELPRDLKSAKGIISWLEKNGFTETRQTGSHRHFEGPNGGLVTVADHGKKDIATGTLSNIRRQIVDAQVDR